MGNVYMEADQVRFKDSTYRNVQEGLAAALEGGGGTTVVANPEGSATADLAKLQVGEGVYGIPSSAAKISYDNTSSHLTADDVQEAIDEMISNFGDGVDRVYNACVSAGSTPASKSPADIATAIGQISTGGTITKIRTHTGEVSDPNISETINITDDGYLFIVGWNFTNTSNIHINSGSNKISEITSYYFAYNGAPIPVSANDVLHYSNTGTGGCNDGIDIYLVTDVTISN